MPSKLSKVFTAELNGIDAELVEVETDLHVGLHSFNIVGLADQALSEAKERISSALKNSGIKPPNRENRKIIVNLAPAHLKKTGSRYDLAIAVGYLLATGQIKEFNTENKIFAGELALDGSVRSIQGALSIACLAKQINKTELFIPADNAQEAALVKGINIFPVANLSQLIDHLEAAQLIVPQPFTILPPTTISSFNISLNDIKGQATAKRALLIAAAGGHNILMSGTPGSGKTMLAQAFASLLPPLSLKEAIEVTKIYSAAGLLTAKPLTARPFRSPHHNASLTAITGGGSNPRPGEVTLAHHGILFLDELPEFRRDALESLRQPLESRIITIARAKKHLTLPANFILIAAMNPCPCGYKDDEEKECRCTANEINRYEKKISGPLLDRIDIQINVPRIKIQDIKTKHANNRDQEYKKQVIASRSRQLARQGKLNSELSSKECHQFIPLTKEAELMMEKIFNQNLITARGYYRTLKLARTIADLEELEKVEARHLGEAFAYRLRQ